MRFYVHDEQVNMICNECARDETIVRDHAHESTESFIVTGKLVIPHSLLLQEVSARINEVAPRGGDIEIAVPDLYEALSA